MDTAVERTATWECRACPADGQVLAQGPHYLDAAAAEAGLRHHFLTEHAAELWDRETRNTVTGRVLEFVELADAS